MQNACKVHFGPNESTSPPAEGNLLPVPWRFGQDPSLFTVDALGFVSKDELLSSAPPEEHLPRHGQFPAASRSLWDAADHFPQLPPTFPRGLGRGWTTSCRGVRNQEPGEHPTLRLTAHAFPRGGVSSDQSASRTRQGGSIPLEEELEGGAASRRPALLRVAARSTSEGDTTLLDDREVLGQSSPSQPVLQPPSLPVCVTSC